MERKRGTPYNSGKVNYHKAMGVKIMEKHFPFLVSNGWSKSGLLVWVDHGKFFKVMLKEEYEKE